MLDHEVEIRADRYLPLTADLLPTGDLAPVAGTPMDFRTPTRSGNASGAGTPRSSRAGLRPQLRARPAERRRRELVLAARVPEPRSGRVLEVWTTEPGIDFYTGNFLDGSLVGHQRAAPTGKGTGSPSSRSTSRTHRTSRSFPTTVLRPGETYVSATEYRFLV